MTYHLRDLNVACSSPGCPKGARVELFNSYNSSLGSFCRPHGARRLRELQREEVLEARKRANHPQEPGDA